MIKNTEYFVSIQNVQQVKVKFSYSWGLIGVPDLVVVLLAMPSQS